jgi:hypothetical protein
MSSTASSSRSVLEGGDQPLTGPMLWFAAVVLARRTSSPCST